MDPQLEFLQHLREHLRNQRERLKVQHQSGLRGKRVCAQMTTVLDELIIEVYQRAIKEASEQIEEPLDGRVVLVPHGGYGRCDSAPFSDIDLMLLHEAGYEEKVRPLAQSLVQNLTDVGLDLGFSVRTPAESCKLALKDIPVLTSLIESRYLIGNVRLFTHFFKRFKKEVRRKPHALIPLLEEARRQERKQYGETIHLLTPNVKRSRGGLRDLQLVRWVGFVKYGITDLEILRKMEVLSQDDYLTQKRATEYLLRMRNELHFHAGKSQNILERSEQLRMAELFGFEGSKGVLPVEQFMREYYRHTGNVRNSVAHFTASCRYKENRLSFLGSLFSSRIGNDFLVGPYHISATAQGLEKVQDDLVSVLEIMNLSNQYTKPIDHNTWETIRGNWATKPIVELSNESANRFLTLMAQPGRLGKLLRRLNELNVLEKIIPGMSHARGLMQFNDYHKYTVDEHCIRTVDFLIELLNDESPLGHAYRTLKNKRTLHLAALLHDLGKGFPEDHSEVGKRLAEKTAKRLRLPWREGETLKFLVHQHLRMAHLATRRDINDPAVVIQFAIEVGSPDVLTMLYLLTCADYAAVGSEALTDWKLNLLTTLYQRAMQHLATDSAPLFIEAEASTKQKELLEFANNEEDVDWFHRQITRIPMTYLQYTTSEVIFEQLRALATLPYKKAIVWGRSLPEVQMTEYRIGTYDQADSKIFQRVTGVLNSSGLRIVSAEIHPLENHLVWDRYLVIDEFFPDGPNEDRIEEICSLLTEKLQESVVPAPAFKRTWQDTQKEETTLALKELTSRVVIDNETSDKYTILDIFTRDKMGLLYTISQTLDDLNLSIAQAKIDTFVDQVVDVFYVTDKQNKKVVNEKALTAIKHRLETVIDAYQLKEK